ncbi:MAG: hypothetical protein JNM84_13815 [Planctomycetes bacterium]|nr:hypothetical protein [Planctomycetota bacterium]
MRITTRAGLALLALCPATSAQEYRLADHLPPETLAYLAVPNVSALRSALGELGLAKLFASAEGRRLIGSVHAIASQGLAQLDPEVRAIFDEILGIANDLRGEVALAFVTLDQERGLPVVAFSADFGERAENFRTLLDRRLKSYAERGLGLGAYDLGGKSVGKVILDGVEIHHGFAGNAWVVSTDGGRMPELLGARGAATLASEPSFSACKARVLPSGSKPIAHLHLGIAPALALFAPMLPPEVRLVIESFGLDAVHAFSYGAAIEGGAVAERFRMHAPEGLGALAELYEAGPANHRPLRFIPANAFVYASGRANFAGLASFYQRLFAQIVPDGEAGVASFLDGMAQQLGFRLETDFVENFGRDIAFYAAMPEGGGLLPEIVLGLDFVDSARFVEHLKKMLAFASEQGGASVVLNEREYLGRTYHSLDIDLPENGVSVMPLRPCLMVQGSSVLMTLFPHHMKAVIERIEGGGAKPSLADDPDFAGLLARAPQGHSSFGYFRAKALISLAYNTVAPIAQAAVRDVARKQLGVDLDLLDLPSAHMLAQHLVDVASWSSIDEHGMESTIVSPTGVMPAIVLIGGVAGFVTARQVAAAPSEVREFEVEPAEPTEPETAEEWEIDENGNLRRKKL